MISITFYEKYLSLFEVLLCERFVLLELVGYEFPFGKKFKHMSSTIAILVLRVGIIFSCCSNLGCFEQLLSSLTYGNSQTKFLLWIWSCGSWCDLFPSSINELFVFLAFSSCYAFYISSIICFLILGSRLTGLKAELLFSLFKWSNLSLSLSNEFWEGSSIAILGADLRFLTAFGEIGDTVDGYAVCFRDKLVSWWLTIEDLLVCTAVSFKVS